MSTQRRPYPANAVTDYLMQHGASAAFVERLMRDLHELPAQYRQRVKWETTRERTDRLRELARRTRSAARAWKRSAQWMTVWPEQVEGEHGREWRGVGTMNGEAPGLPFVHEYLASLAEMLEHEARKPVYLEFRRRPPLRTFVVLSVLVRLLETGAYSRRPHKHVAELSGLILGRRLDSETVRAIVKRAR